MKHETARIICWVNDYADTAFKNLRYSLSDAVAFSVAFAARGFGVGLLEDVTNGHGGNRAFLLDVCRTDVFAGVENRDMETRDMAFVSFPDAKKHVGTCCVLRSCDRFWPAMGVAVPCNKSERSLVLYSRQ